MADYIVINDVEVEPEAPIISSLGVRWRDNAIAIAEGADGAPVVRAGWHPYDLSNVGDSDDGEIYSFGTDGSVASVETPDFEDGYEYAIHFRNLVSNEGSGNQSFEIEVYQDVDAGYQTLFSSTGEITLTETISGMARIAFPRKLGRGRSLHWEIPLTENDPTTGGVLAFLPSTVFDVTAQQVLRARISMPGASIVGGSIFLLRRREYTSG